MFLPKYSILLAIVLPHLALTCQVKEDGKSLVRYGRVAKYSRTPDLDDLEFAGFKDHDLKKNESFGGKSGRIVDVTPIDKYPWQVSVQWLDEYYEERWHFCGGFILNARWIGTAAWCVFGYEDMPERLGILSGTNDLTQGGYLSSIHQILLHNRYDYYTNANDIAWIKLENDLDLNGNTRKAIALPEQGLVLRNNKKVEVSGWGSIYFDGPWSEMLQSVEMRSVGLRQCRNTYRNIYDVDIKEYLDKTKTCAGQLNKNACYGNYGDALVMKTQNPEILIGIVSDVYMCGENNIPSIFTAVSQYSDLTACVISK